MKQTGKRILSMLCTLAMLLSLAAMIVPGAYAAETADANEIDAIPSGHLASMRDYSAFATEAGKTAYVDDAEAYGGKAVCYSKANFDGGDFLAIKRYDSGKEVSIAQLFKEDLQINDGYHIYKIEYAVPADATEGSVFFIMPNWQLNSSAFCKDFAPYAGKTVEVYLSMKITGPDADGLYSVSVDRVALASVCEDYMEDGICTKCGEVDELLNSIPDEHLASVRDYSDFGTEAGKTEYVDDAEAYGGKAVCYSKANFDGGDFLAIKRYDSGKEVTIAQLFKENLQINDGYHVYKITYAVPADATEGSVFFIMPNWQLNSSAFCKDFAPYAGKTVEVYLSMKITGPGEDGLYSVSVDRVALASVCDDHMSEDGSTCTLCGKTDELLKAIPIEHRASVRNYSTFSTDASNNTVYVDDAEAHGGKAVCHTTGNPYMSINRYDVASGLSDGHPSLRIGTLALEELKLNAGYQLYKFTYDVPVETTAGNTFYIMPNWQLNNSTFCADFAAYAGKTVDVYLSIKVTGPTADGYYSIYVDRVALATACEWDDGVVTTQPTTTTEGVKTYTCSVCNNTKTESVEKLTVPAASWNLVLDGNISMNFHLNVTAEQIDTATVDVTINGVTTTTNVNTLPKDENNLPILSVELAAAQMTEPVAVVVRAGDVELVKNYTVREYADYILDEANGYGEEVKALVKNMLNYGAASQNYFDYNSGLLANDGLDITAATVLTEGGEIAVTGSVSGLAFYGATLVHKNKIAVRFYFTGSIEGIETDYAIKEKNGMYYIEVADIVPQDLDQDTTISVSDGTNTLSISYAPMDYIIRMYNKESSSENTKALVQALYGYYLAAEAYTTAS